MGVRPEQESPFDRLMRANYSLPSFGRTREAASELSRVAEIEPEPYLVDREEMALKMREASSWLVEHGLELGDSFVELGSRLVSDAIVEPGGSVMNLILQCNHGSVKLGFNRRNTDIGLEALYPNGWKNERLQLGKLRAIGVLSRLSTDDLEAVYLNQDLENESEAVFVVITDEGEYIVDDVGSVFKFPVQD